jgi:hypothetical protein
LILLFPNIIEEETLEYLFDNVVNGEELPAHAKQEKLGVPMSNEDFVDCICKFVILMIDSRVLKMSRNL